MTTCEKCRDECYAVGLERLSSCCDAPVVETRGGPVPADDDGKRMGRVLVASSPSELKAMIQGVAEKVAAEVTHQSAAQGRAHFIGVEAWNAFRILVGLEGMGGTPDEVARKAVDYAVALEAAVAAKTREILETAESKET